MTLETMKSKYRYSELCMKPNYRLIPTTALGINDESAIEFNEIVEWVESLGLRRLVRTKSGGISIHRKKFYGNGWDLTSNGYCIEIVIIYRYMWRIQFRNNNIVIDNEEIEMYGRQGFNMFVNVCKKYGIDLEKYKTDNGKEIKKEIEKPLIEVSGPNIIGNVYTGANHIDFHNSYPAGLVNTHPEFRGPVEELYKGRKEHKEYKFVLNSAIGYMQSVGACGAKWAHLSRDAINDNNKRIRDLRDRLVASGRKILAFNTDGIWYAGEVYHGEGEGKNLGDWENDHVDCKIRFKSKGSYEFIEDDVYYPVVRGKTRYDRVKDRKEWVWGDIFRDDCNVIAYRLINNRICNEKGEILK